MAGPQASTRSRRPRNTNRLVTRIAPVKVPGYPESHYIENIGAHADIPLDYMTRENLLTGGRPFVEAFTRAIVEHIRPDSDESTLRSPLSRLAEAATPLVVAAAGHLTEDYIHTRSARMRRNRLVIAAVLCLLVGRTDVDVQSGDDWRRPASKQWPTVSGDWGNTRHSTLNQITTQNVAKLGGAWTSQKFESAAGARTMPVVHDGLMFLTVPPSVYALDAKTGARVWRFQAGPQAGMGAPAREGVAVGDGLVFVGLSDARVIALERRPESWCGTSTSATRRATRAGRFGRAALCGRDRVDRLERRQRLARADRRAERQDRGGSVAVLRGAGARRAGIETWPKGSPIWQRGGGAVWLVGAADPDLGLVYYVTGNGVPQLGGRRAARRRICICARSIALDMKTGKLRWHYQVIRHDIWEADIAISPVLVRRADRWPCRGRRSPRCAPTATCSCWIARPESR